jgi:DNA-binding response OmpR family regulator
LLPVVCGTASMLRGLIWSKIIKAGGARSRTVRERILIVEDDFLIAEQIRHVLSEAGYNVVGMAGRTQKAEEIAREYHAELAIVSLMMEADVDGVRTATYLQCKHRMKILITTGFHDALVHHWVGSAKKWPLLRKPFSENELLTAVGACLAEANTDSCPKT